MGSDSYFFSCILRFHILKNRERNCELETALNHIVFFILLRLATHVDVVSKLDNRYDIYD